MIRKSAISMSCIVLIAITSCYAQEIIAAFSSFYHGIPNHTRGDFKATSLSMAQEDSEDAEVTGVPKILFPETSYNFGTIPQGSNVSHTFVFRNVGSAPLRIINAKGS